MRSWLRPCLKRRRFALLILAVPVLLLILNIKLHRLLPKLQQPEPTSIQPAFRDFMIGLANKLTPKPQYTNISHLWVEVKKWPQSTQAYSLEPPIGNLIEALSKAKIIRADNAKKGTQLKLLLTLEGGENVLFKPQWYSRDDIIHGSVYSGKDRHNAEVVAFYLSIMLDTKWTPVAAIRKLNMQTDVWDKATPELRETMFQLDDGTFCLYGKCFYCRRNETVCGDKQNELEGAVIHVIDQRFSKYRSPWQRTYTDKPAEWEAKQDYCVKVKKISTPTRLLDLVDVAIFDYLLQNGDRHHYETMMDRVLYLDNGKGLGNPNKDFNDILAPLYQCCVLRHSTWKRLKMLSGGHLSASLSNLMSNELGGVPLTESHLQAMDRRLLIVYSVVQSCLNKFGKAIFKDK